MKATMNCKTCGQPMRQDKSSVGVMSCVGYLSPDGHDHDDNCVVRTYVCPNGHSAAVSKRRTCPVCDWKGKETCFCHQDPKVDEWPEEVE